MTEPADEPVSDGAAEQAVVILSGLSGGGTSLEASNMAGYYLRHRNSEVWMDPNTGGTTLPRMNAGANVSPTRAYTTHDSGRTSASRRAPATA